MKKTLSWSDVVKIHGTIGGISQKDGKVKSLLCNATGDGFYPNKIEKDKITYFVGPKTQTHGINALIKSWKAGNAFPVFEKMGINKWRKLGDFVIRGHKKEKDDYFSFHLEKP